MTEKRSRNADPEYYEPKQAEKPVVDPMPGNERHAVAHLAQIGRENEAVALAIAREKGLAPPPEVGEVVLYGKVRVPDTGMRGVELVPALVTHVTVRIKTDPPTREQSIHHARTVVIPGNVVKYYDLGLAVFDAVNMQVEWLKDVEQATNNDSYADRWVWRSWR